MIPAAFIESWRGHAPWPTDEQVEQDLILSRLIIEIANDELLAPELSLRGGTCLHKLHHEPAARYSEDLDYVRMTHSGIKPYLQALRTIGERIGLDADPAVERSGQMVHMIFDATPTLGAGRIRIKIETNIRETESYRPRITKTHQLDSSWWQGQGKVNTYILEELLGTKMRCLYQRRKGRDLFDLWLFLTEHRVDDALIVGALNHYMEQQAFSYSDLVPNLREKLANQEFIADLDDLIATRPDDYDLDSAADLVMERLGSKLANAPDLHEIRNGRWRE